VSTKASDVKSALLGAGIPEAEADAQVDRMVLEKSITVDDRTMAVDMTKFGNIVASLAKAVTAPADGFWGAKATPDAPATNVDELSKSLGAVGARVDKLAEASQTSTEGLAKALGALGELNTELVKAVAGMQAKLESLTLAAPAAKAPMAKSVATTPGNDPRALPEGAAAEGPSNADLYDQAEAAIGREMASLAKSTDQVSLQRRQALRMASGQLTAFPAAQVISKFNLQTVKGA